jgi:hypothetical protein
VKGPLERGRKEWAETAAQSSRVPRNEERRIGPKIIINIRGSQVGVQ